MNKENISIKELDFIFDKELKAYLSLEKNIFELMNRYENEPSDLLKEVLLRFIPDAKKQIIVLLGIISDHYTGEMKVSFSNKLGVKLNDLHDMEEKIYSMNKSK